MKPLKLLSLTTLFAASLASVGAHAAGDPYTGEAAKKNQAGAGGYNRVVLNEGASITQEARDLRRNGKPAVAPANPTPRADHELAYRKDPAGTGNSSDNSRLDPGTGKVMLPNTEASSNPANPKAPTAPGGTAALRPGEFKNRMGEQNGGAFADMNMPTGGGTPMDEMERSTATEVLFTAGKADLNEETKQKLEALLADARTKGPIDAIKVVAWADSETPKGKEKLSKEQVKLASERGKVIEDFYKEKTDDIRVSSVNMAKKASMLDGIVSISDKRLRSQLDKSGIGSGKASRAMVLVVMKR